jgi:hypothetical protein
MISKTHEAPKPTNTQKQKQKTTRLFGQRTLFVCTGYISCIWVWEACFFLFGNALEGFWDGFLCLFNDGFFSLFGFLGERLFMAAVAVGETSC